MEEIASYLFDNSDDFKECHYLALMNLVGKVHTQIQFPIIINNQPQWSVHSIDLENYSFNIMTQRCSSFIEVTERQWVRFARILELNNYEEFVHQLDWTIPEDYQINSQAFFKYRFVLPDTLTKETRQKIHIMSAVSGRFETESQFIERIPNTNQWKKKLNIFISDFNQNT
jgi:hypothetical protein